MDMSQAVRCQHSIHRLPVCDSKVSHIPFNRVRWVGNEFAYIKGIVEAGHVSGAGPFTLRVEEFISHLLGSPNLLTTSCTHALELAALLLDLKQDCRNEVIVPSFTFVTTASAFTLHGFSIKFADVQKSDLNIDPESVEQLITPRTRAICAINYAGRAADFEKLRKLATKHGITIIEDNAHGFGGSFGNTRLGTLGDISTHSFHETKNFSCGEGGNVVLNDTKFLERAEILREKGTNRSRFLRGQVDKYTWVDIGSSWVMSDILAAVLFAQLERMDQVITKRMDIYNSYHQEISQWAQSNDVRVPANDVRNIHTAHMFYLQLPTLQSRTRFIRHLANLNINAVFHYQALNKSPVGLELGSAVGQCPVAEEASDTLVRIPIFESLSDGEIDRVIEGVTTFTVSD